MSPHYTDDTVTLHHGDCRDVLTELPDASVDAVVTDPPYELGFMGKGWDSSGIAYSVPMWSEVLRVLKPGGHLLAFGGTRTWHRMVVAIEDAGFEIRDELVWLYGSGFPKSLDVSKAIDKQRHKDGDKLKVTTWLADVADARGVTRAQVDQHMGTSDMGGWWLSRLRHRCAVPTLEQVPRLLDVLGVDLDDVPDDIRALLWTLNGNKGQPGPNWAKREVVGTKRAVPGVAFSSSGPSELEITAPATPEAQQWDGWGTALKPAHEPICLARKPLVGTVAANVLEHGTGALNVDGCRIEGKPRTTHSDGNRVTTVAASGHLAGKMPHGPTPAPPGRWPANVLLDEAAAAMLDEQSGTLTSGANPTRRGSDKFRDAYGEFSGQEDCVAHRGADSGGASRFFYVAKASTAERPKVDGVAHATVKPLELMRWLVRLVTPPGGLVLDPFAGTGTTAEACIVEGFRCVLIEKEADHLPLIEARLAKPIQPSLGLAGGGRRQARGGAL